ncbi:MAG TPA: DUF6476 family protein [Hypericibacter adhaerens]|jgi:hypothetical protein|uniref:Uncharacterized protein n=1 Tax=Hypericibacter adhaerens TaxID=2602016 RepID=A0A5J6N3C1_9PROT|nr:DUF6476 family protein [Hypericibacter adhaerens]QEX23967.1 hypothetical protein FRZ61_39080 [Hypericibacter adhaerens]HWA45520.1 DUF6476 family protein [Hypericibacter adhaerens]
MRALKALVIVMGIIIVVGVAIVVATIVNRLQHKTPAITSEATGTAQLGDVVLPLPPGCQVAEMTAAADRLWLRLTPLTGNSADAACADILILDPATGTVVGRLIPGTPG